MLKKCCILLLLVFTFGSVNVWAGDWSREDTIRESVYCVLHIADWAQTDYIAAHPMDYKETNPILGQHPTHADVNQYFIATGLLHIGVAYVLPPKWREAFQYVTIGVEAGAVAHNAKIGIKIKF